MRNTDFTDPPPSKPPPGWLRGLLIAATLVGMVLAGDMFMAAAQMDTFVPFKPSPVIMLVLILVALFGGLYYLNLGIKTPAGTSVEERKQFLSRQIRRVPWWRFITICLIGGAYTWVRFVAAPWKESDGRSIALLYILLFAVSLLLLLPLRKAKKEVETRSTSN